MKVLYDFQTFALQTHGGVSRYFHELIDYFQRTGTISLELGVRHTSNHYLLAADGGTSALRPIAPTMTFERFLGGRKFRGKGRVFRLYSRFASGVKAYDENKSYSAELLKSSAYDVFHPTYYDPYFIQLVGNKPVVVTVHDMIHELFPGYFKPDDDLTGWKRRTVERADEIIAVSENTKRDITRVMEVDPERITVVPHGTNLHLVAGLPHGLQLPSSFIAYVGDRSQYKNFDFLVRAFARCRHDELNLVCFGSHPFRDEEKAFFRDHGMSGRVHHVEADDRRLAEGYRKAMALVYPSLYEGFGIPIIEAFSCGCPVICSNTSCFPEVARDAALFFDPRDMEAITSAIDRMADDRELRQTLITRGKALAASYTVERTAEATRAVYEKAASRSGHASSGRKAIA